MTVTSTSILPAWLSGMWLFLLASASAAETIPPDKAVITLTPKFGPVTFNHQRHSELDAVQCATCHHTGVSAVEPIRSCYSCHEAVHFSIARIAKHGPGTTDTDNVEFKIRNAQQAFHDLCIGCHKRQREQGLASGPDDGCRDCHK